MSEYQDPSNKGASPPPLESLPYASSSTQVPQNNHYGATPPKTSQLAIWSMVCSILGFFTCMLTTLPGIIMGHVSLSKIKNSNGSLGGKGMGIAGIAVGYSSLLLIIPALAAISSPIILRQISRARATEAVSNSKEIFISLREYGFSRGGATIAKEGEASANDYLRVLFETDDASDESVFSVKGVNGSVEPDGNTLGDNALSRGENVFSYVISNSKITEIRRPYLVTPLYKEGNTVKIDTSAFGGQLVVLYTDGSVEVYPVFDELSAFDQKTGDPIFDEGKMWGVNDNGRFVSYEVATPDY